MQPPDLQCLPSLPIESCHNVSIGRVCRQLGNYISVLPIRQHLSHVQCHDMSLKHKGIWTGPHLGSSSQVWCGERAP